MESAHRYAFPDRFIAGAVGEPDRRTFFVQTRQGSRMTNVVCELQQIRVLAEHLEHVLAELERAGLAGDKERRSSRPHDSEPLDVPLDEDFRAGTMIITWLPDSASLRIELFAQGAYRRADRHPDEVLQVVITLDQARDFVARAVQMVGSNAPSCPFCGQPIGPDGHICPRANGYRKPLLDLTD
ncbi:DUF3090 domain-containing protein [Brooklawnia cerclae]|uniref:Repeat protein (TIGR03847 family) n=1 Tax=Brooklawnia cerclae TaxID=349934 RepID=A0ABX0SHL1_9ACTN|nr:DUF3090 domain-containing protein [Brooklawnia cerclae]NIH56096.1 putative repeat protein (TIGR03847 family) [Brooklawnia cerclae]